MDSAAREGIPGPGQEEPAAEPGVLRMLLGAQLRRLVESAPLPDVVYIEQLTSAVYLDQRANVEHYLEVADQLSGEALPPAGPIRFIKQVAREA